MKFKNIFLTGLALVLMAGVASAELPGVGTATINSKPAGQTREQAMFRALGHTLVSNGCYRTQAVTPNSGSEAASVILPGIRNVEVGAVTNDTDDFIVLPSLSSVTNGHEIRVCSNAGGAYEIRTPASSNEKINTVDADGTNEYLGVDAEIHVFVKVSDNDGWSAFDIPALGGVGTATVPD